MRIGRRVPFQNLTSKEKLNLALVATVVCYLGFGVVMIYSTNFCGLLCILVWGKNHER